MLTEGLNVLIDGQWGSTGKGKLAGYLGHRCSPALACSSFGPNAGHTFCAIDGIEKVVFKIMPMAALTATCPALIMPDSVFDVERFFKERAILGDIPVYVHPHASVLESFDADAAKRTGHRLAGTMQGTGHALSRKMLRLEGVRLAKDVLPPAYIADTCQMVRDACKEGKKVLFEISQGYDLSLNHGWLYPYVTSRDITVGACLNSANVPARYLANVIGCIRTFPIRVGNIKGGHSGPFYPDHQELSWGEVTQQAGGPEDLLEKTTVTKRVRRVFSFSMMQIKRFVEATWPTYFFLNFVQYLNWDAHKVTEWRDLPEECKMFSNNLEKATGVPVRLLGTGADLTEMVEK